MELGWTRSLSDSFSVTPALSYYTRSAARFHGDSPTGERRSLPLTPDDSYSTLDQRLGAFGGVTGSVRALWQVSGGWPTRFRGAGHEERSSWRVFGAGSPGMNRFCCASVTLDVALGS